MQPGTPEYERMKAAMPDIFGGSISVRAKFTVQPEPDPVATEATGKKAPEIQSSNFDMATGNLTLLAAPVEEKGFTVYRDVIYIEERTINSDGRLEKDFQSMKATPAHKAQYPREWAAFEAEQKLATEQHSLSAIKGMSPAAMATFYGIGIRSVEQLAESPIELPESLDALRQYGKRLLAFMSGRKPRYKLINGELQEVA